MHAVSNLSRKYIKTRFTMAFYTGYQTLKHCISIPKFSVLRNFFASSRITNQNNKSQSANVNSYFINFTNFAREREREREREGTSIL